MTPNRHEVADGKRKSVAVLQRDCLGSRFVRAFLRLFASHPVFALFLLADLLQLLKRGVTLCNLRVEKQGLTNAISATCHNATNNEDATSQYHSLAEPKRVQVYDISTEECGTARATRKEKKPANTGNDEAEDGCWMRKHTTSLGNHMDLDGCAFLMQAQACGVDTTSDNCATGSRRSASNLAALEGERGWGREFWHRLGTGAGGVAREISKLEFSE
jgi:hypothetical protein